MNIGERIAQLRKQRGMTQEQLADQLGTTRQAVSKWEAGKTNPDIDYVIAMSAHFGVTTDYLLLGTGEATDQAPPASGDHSRLYRVLLIVLLAIGICVVLSLPLIATLYRNYTFGACGSAYTDAMVYLREWPLKGIVILSFGAIFAGAGGIIWLHRRTKI